MRGKLERTPKGEALHLTVYPEWSPNMDSILFLEIIKYTSCIAFKGRVILEEMNLCIPLPWRALFHRALPKGNILPYAP